MLPTLPSITEAQTQMKQGKLRPIDLVEHCLGRIHQFEDQIHAWVMVDEEGARGEALRLGKMLDDGQEPVGPLHGIPIGIKDIIDVAGWPTLCGSKLREGHVAEKDAAVVDKLRKAGAIVLGKTVTTEWASFDPPPTRNPWNLNHTPGGSSSGSAAAVAMEMCLAALGTQTGGSIVRPASYCGVVGLKPDFRGSNLDGIFPFSRSLDHVGPIARTVADAKVVYDVMNPEIGGVPPEIASHKIFFLEGGFLNQADSATRARLKETQSLLAEHLSLGTFELPAYFAEIHRLHRRIMAVEAAEVHKESYEANPDDYSPQIRTLIEEGRAASVLDYARALRRKEQIWKLFFHDCKNLGETPVFAMASTATPAPERGTTGDPLFNSPWSFLGVPTITIPMGTSADGLPLGLQLITFTLIVWRSFFGFFQECESVIDFTSRPPILSAHQP
jgi:Asp-tRNA(Asn)/Glu-tRNA(Gln) amidotransferase A subunit family amidase